MRKKEDRGITLVALVITIIILLILAGITITQLTGSGLFEKTELAKEKIENVQIKEDEILTDYEDKIDEISGTRNSQGQDNVKLCNPKQLINLDLEESGKTARNTGTYYASSSFKKNTTNDFSKYLEENENGGWTVLKSGYYLISNTVRSHYNGSNYSESYNYIMLDDMSITINGAINRENAQYAKNFNTTTIYIVSGTKLEFFNTIVNASAIYHASGFFVYAMFE